MKRLLFIFAMIAISVLTVSAQSDYYIKKAQSYQRTGGRGKGFSEEKQTRVIVC